MLFTTLYEFIYLSQNFHNIELICNYSHFILEFSPVSNNLYCNQEHSGSAQGEMGGQARAEAPAKPEFQPGPIFLP